MEKAKVEKDIWDKFEIVVKAIGTVLVPVLVAIALLIWNLDRTRQQTASSLLPLAVSILKTPIESEDGLKLRKWATEVMNSPSDPPAITEEISYLLAGINLPVLPDALKKPCRHPIDFLDEFGEGGLVQSEVEILMGRMGVELIDCNKKRQIVIDYYNDLRTTLSD